MRGPFHLAAAFLVQVGATALRATTLAGTALGATVLSAQTRTASTDTVRINDLHVAVERNDQRAAQAALLRTQGDLRNQSIMAERLPTIGFSGQAQYLSAVTSLSAPNIPGFSIPQPFNDQYDAYMTARQTLFDPSRRGRAAIEAAQTTEGEATLAATLYRTRLQVNDLFFSVLQADAQSRTLSAAIALLESHRSIAAARVRDGVALPSEELAITAEITRRRQTQETLNAERLAAIHMLASLTGTAIDANTVLSVPDVRSAVTSVRDRLMNERTRPEYQQFAATRQTIEARREALTAQTKPRVSAFGRAGYGRPGINQLSRDFDTYWITGVQVEWSPFRWSGIGTSPDRDRQILKLQQDIVATEEAAFTDGLRRTITRDIELLDQLTRSIAIDDEVIALREQILAESQLRFQEGVITSSQLVDHETELTSARLERDSRRIGVLRLEAQILTTAGYPVR